MFATQSSSKGIDTNIAGNSETDDMGSVSTFTTIGNVSWGNKTSEKLDGTKRNGKVENGRSSVIGLACMIVFLGVVAGSALAYLGFRAEKNGRLDDFQRGAFVTVSKVEESFEDYVETASMIHGRFRHRPEFDGMAFASNTDTYIEEYMAWSKQFRSEFHETYQYVKATDLRFKAMQFTPYISSQERGLAENEIMDFLSKNYPEAAATYKGFRGFNGPNSTSLEPRWNQPFYFPIHYMEPIAGNEAAIDLDYYSSQSRMRAVDALFETKEPSMTDRLSLVKKEGTLSRCSSGDGDVAEGQGPSYGIVLMHPGHKLDSDDDTTWPKEFSAMVLCMSDLISRSNDHQSRPISMYIHDLSHPDSDKPVFMGAASLVKNQTAEESEIDDYNTILLNETDLDQVECRGDDSCYQRNITIANRIWTVTILDQHARNRSRMVYISLVGVIAFFAFLCLAIWVLNTDKRNRKYASIKAEAAAERNALVLENANRAAQTERELNDFLAHEVRNPLSAAMAATSFLRTELDRKSKRNKSDKGLRLHFDDTIDEKNSNEDEKEDYSVSLKDTDSTTMARDSSAKSIGSFSSPRLVQAREDVRVVDHALHFINELLRNMLDMHRASSGKMLVKLAPVDLLRDVLEPVAGMLHRGGEGRIGRNGKGDEKVKIIVDCPEDIVVETDILRLKQVVLNLGRNSVKFINEGFIRLRAEVIEVECDHDHSRFSDDIESGNIKCKTVRIYVEDSGSGIPIEKRETLFAKYQESLDLLSQGTGIGLNLCKNLVELMGGEISLDNDYDSGIPDNPGARFVVDLQSAPLDTSVIGLPTTLENSRDATAHVNFAEMTMKSFDEMEEEYKEMSGKDIGLPELPTDLNVLFVDDDRVLRKLFTRTLKIVAPNWNIREAANGETAILLAQEENFDLIFCDMYMASVEKQLLGTEAVAELRSNGCKSRICGLSANDKEHEFLAAGADYFLYKPIPCEASVLQKTLYDVLYH